MPLRERHNDHFLVSLPPEHLHGVLAERAHTTQGKYKLDGAPRPTLRIHVTIANVNKLAPISEMIVEKAEWAVPQVIKATKSFNLVFDRVKSFANNNACVLSTSGNDHEFRALCRQVSRGLRVPVSATPHATLLYDSKMISDDLLEEPIVWPVSEIFLVEAVNNEGNFRIHASFLLSAS